MAGDAPNLRKRTRTSGNLQNGSASKSQRTSTAALATQTAPTRRSLRDRASLSSVSSPSKAASALQLTPQKRRQVSVIVPTNYGTVPQEESEGPQQPPVKKRKTWLAQGLYSGQASDANPKVPSSKSRKKSAANVPIKKIGRTMLPLPMFGYLDQERGFRLPFDVYSPLPKGQPKPDEWKKTRSNQFVGDAKEEWKIHKHSAPSACMCIPESGCDEQCLNRIMKYECDDNNCAIGPEHCANRRFAELKDRVKSGKKYNIGVEVVSTEGKGFGVRAARTFEPNQIIVEYSGEIITQDECHRRLNEEYKNSKAYYLMAFDQNMIIDATKGSIARFINHSCNPNCTMEQWVVHGKPRMALFAGEQGIMTGEELTYDYNYDSFSKKVQKCLCGAANCRGVLGPRPPKEKERKILEALEGITSGLKRKAADLLSGKALSGASTAKKRRVSAPVRKIAISASKKSKTKNAIGSQKKRRATDGAVSRTALDKENSTPRSSSSSRSNSTMSSSDFVRRASGNGKRASGMKDASLYDLITDPLKTVGSSVVKRAKATPKSVKAIAGKLNGSAKPASEAGEKGWNTFGKTGRGGKWRYEVVTVGSGRK